MHRITTAPVAPIPTRTRWAVAAGAGAALATSPMDTAEPVFSASSRLRLACREERAELSARRPMRTPNAACSTCRCRS
jgi:hypothetical protein